MKIFTCITPAFEKLFNDHFVPSLTPNLELINHTINLQGQGDYLSEEWLECINHKVHLILRSIQANPGEIIIWSDVDIIFFADPEPEIQKIFQDPRISIAMQHESKHNPYINGGFLVIRSNKESEAFYQKLLELLPKFFPEEHEQDVMNKMLHSPEYKFDIGWAHLPWSFSARSHGWPPPRNLTMYHANYTSGKDGLGQKLKQFKEIRWIQKYGIPAIILTSIPKIPNRIKRWLGLKKV